MAAAGGSAEVFAADCATVGSSFVSRGGNGKTKASAAEPRAVWDWYLARV